MYLEQTNGSAAGKTHVKRESLVIALYILGANQRRRRKQNTTEEVVTGDCVVCIDAAASKTHTKRESPVIALYILGTN